jgi:hypothetical protein
MVPFSAALQVLKNPDLQKVLAQVRWSIQPLHPLGGGPVELQIGGQKQQVSGAADRYKEVNLADDGGGRVEDPEMFYVVDRRVATPTGALPAVLSSAEFNKDVAKAALSRDGRAAAVVTTGNRLVLGRLSTAAPPVQPVDRLRGTTWSRPVWLPSSRRLLVAVDGLLHVVGDAGDVSEPLATGVTSFAVSPEGFRIALIQGGALQVAALVQRDNDLWEIGIARTLSTGLANLTAVAWSRLDRLVAAGPEGGNWLLTEISVDGALREKWNARFHNQIVSVVAYPRLPSQVSSPGPVLVQTADNSAFHVYGSSSQPDPLDTPTATPSGGAGVQRSVPPTAPFFPD